MAVGDAKNKRPTRWERAKADRPRLQWSDLGIPAGGLVLAVIVLAAAGASLSVLAEVGIVGGSAVAAAILYALGQLVWAWLQPPMRMLTEEVIAIRERVEALPLSPTSAPIQEVNVRGTVLTDLNRGRSLLSLTMLRIGQVESWTEQATQFLSEYVSAQEAEAFLECTEETGRIGLAARVQYLADLAERLRNDVG